MTLFLDKPRDIAPRSIAGGNAGLGDIYQLSRDSMRFIDNANADYVALSEAYDRRVADILDATGQRLENPLVAAQNEWRARQALPQSPIGHMASPRETHTQMAERRQAAFQQSLSDLAAKHPDKSDRIAADRPLTDDALGIMRETEHRLDEAMAARGSSRWLAVLAGGFSGMMRDPVNVGSMFLGGGPGAARTIVGRIATVAAKESAINASLEAALQPMIQARRARADLPSGFAEGMRNVGFAALFGGVLGGSVQGAGEVAARFLPKRQAATAAAQASQATASLRADLPADVRGAVDAAEIINHADAVRPPQVETRIHDDAIARADEAIADPFATPPPAAIDAAKTTRVADQVLGISDKQAVADLKRAATARTESLVEFLAASGGIRQQGGELSQIGADTLRGKRRKLVQKDGAPLDMARERAAEAGFFDDKYGTPAAAVEQSTIVDLLDALDSEARGAPVYRGGEERGADPVAVADANRSYVEGRIAEIQELVGPGVDDAVIARAFHLAHGEGLDIEDAAYRAVMDTPDVARAGRTGEPLPGWDDESLESASDALRTDDASGGLDDPAHVDEDYLLTDADLADLDDLDIPLGGELGDELGDMAALVDDIRLAENLSSVVEACRL